MKENVWDRLSAKYDTLWVQRYSLAPSRRRIHQLLASMQKKSFALLDVGCATGQLLGEIETSFPQAQLLGIDKSPQMIAAAQKRATGIEFRCVAAQDFVTEEQFDVITCCHSLPYYPQKAQVLQNLATMLREDGRAIFIAASINSPYDRLVMALVEKTAEQADYLSRKEFCQLVAPYFTVEESFTIREKWFMPSICGFVLRKKQ